MAGALAFADGFVKNPELFDKIQIGTTTSKQVTEILGPPRSVSQFPRRGVEAWDYYFWDFRRRVNVSIEIDGSGVVRNVLQLPYFSPT